MKSAKVSKRLAFVILSEAKNLRDPSLQNVHSSVQDDRTKLCANPSKCEFVTEHFEKMGSSASRLA